MDWLIDWLSDGLIDQLIVIFQISQQLDVVHKLERDLTQSTRSYEELKQQSEEEVSETPDENANFSFNT